MKELNIILIIVLILVCLAFGMWQVILFLLGAAIIGMLVLFLLVTGIKEKEKPKSAD